jgi:hypothetical protein
LRKLSRATKTQAFGDGLLLRVLLRKGGPHSSGQQVRRIGRQQWRRRDVKHLRESGSLVRRGLDETGQIECWRDVLNPAIFWP